MRQKRATKIALCKRAYLCDMRLLHVVAGKLKPFNFPVERSEIDLVRIVLFFLFVSCLDLQD